MIPAVLNALFKISCVRGGGIGLVESKHELGAIPDLTTVFLAQREDRRRGFVTGWLFRP